MGSPAMSRDPSLPGRHQCSRCGLIWHCPNRSCAPEVAPINTTLLCLTCDVAKHYHKLEQAEAALIRAQASKGESLRQGSTAIKPRPSWST